MRLQLGPRVTEIFLSNDQKRSSSVSLDLQSKETQHQVNAFSRRPAVRRTRLLPWWEVLLHSGCVVCAAIIFALCVTNTYFSDFDGYNVASALNSLQFGAKGHEMLLSASLSTMVLYLVRYELCAADGLPLEYVGYAFQLSKIDQLLSRDFWTPRGAQTDMTARPRIHWFGVTMSLATVTLAILGPSSAILLIPELNWWPVPDPFSGHGGIMYYNQSYSVLWPDHLNSTMVAGLEECLQDGPRSNLLPPKCLFNMMPEISQWLVNNYNRGSPPNLTRSADLGVIRYLTSSDITNTPTSNDTVEGYAVGASAMTFLARNLDAIWLYAKKKKFNLVTPSRTQVSLLSTNDAAPLRKPLVQVQCGFPYDITNLTSINVTFPTDRIRTKSGPLNLMNWSTPMNLSAFQNLSSGPAFQWVDFPATDQPLMSAVLGMKFFSPQLIFGPSFQGPEAVGLMPCTIATHWIPTTLARESLFGSNLVLDNADPMAAVQNTALMASARDLHIDRSYLDAVNTPVLDRDKPLGVIAWILDQVSYKPGHGFDGVWRARWPWLVATTISLALTDGLARFADGEPLYYWDVPPNKAVNNSYVVTLEYSNNGDNYNYELPATQNYEFANYIRSTPELHTEVKWTVDRYGYAWGLGRVTKYLAATVITAHTLLIFVYVGFFVMRRWRCDSWANLTEIITLAIQSPRSALSGHRVSVSGNTVQILEDVVDRNRAVFGVENEETLLDGSNQPVDPQEVSWMSTGTRRLKPEKKYL